MSNPPLSEEIKKQTLEAYEAAGRNQTKAAASLGIPRETFISRLNRARKNKSVEDLRPMIPDGQKLRGVSTLYKDGEAVLQWVKTNEDHERLLQILREAVEDLKKDIPREKPKDYSVTTESDLCSVYVLTDYHVGQMSWSEESGEDWGTDKSCDFLVRWFEKAIASAPDSEMAILCQLGDFLHYDSIESVTPTSKHLLDTDSRYAFIVKVAIKALRRIIGMMLEKHRHVHIKMAEGNHDISSSIWLRQLFAALYENETRVTVDDSPIPYYVFEWGKTALFFHHGHKRSMKDLSKVFAGNFREIFGRTKYAYAHMGHYHHIESKEDSLMVVEQHPTMAPKDAHSVRGGYQSNRGASVITYSKIHGEVSRATCRPEMVLT